MRPSRMLLPLALVLLAMLPALPARAGSGSDPEAPDFVAGEIEHVANIGGFSGSDIEFASRTVTKLSDGATGDPVCRRDPLGACMVDGSGNVIYETEVRDFAVAGGYGTNARIVDITDPRNAVLIGITPCSISQNDIQIQGDLLLLASDGTGSCRRADGGTASFSGTAVLDFSDPRDPTYISRLQYGRGSHNHTFVPGKPVVYLSDSDVSSAGLGNIPIWDLSDPKNPVMRFEFKLGAHSPHDITFNEAGTRAYVAAVTLTYILNTEDPFNPTIVSVIPNEGVSISHQADPTPDGDYLLVTDELGGGLAGASPGGPVHVYDIRVEARPVKVGLIWNDCLENTCYPASDIVPVSTAHVLRINPDGYTMAIAWYKDGLGVIDFSSVRGANAAGSGAAAKITPKVMAWIRMPNANTWAAKMWMERHPGYVFTNDIRRGMDIFYVPEMGPGFVARGTIGVGHRGTYAADAGVTMQEWLNTCEYTPRSNGVDAWVAKLPAGLGDGKHTLFAKANTGGTGLHDLDLWFYDGECGLLGEAGQADTDTSGEIPEGSVYVLVANFTGEPLSVTLSAAST